MPSDKRRAPRRYLKYPARIDLGDGTAPLSCALADVSAAGARVVVAEVPSMLAQEVTLHLGPETSPTRRCKIVWSKGNEIGLEFILPPKPAKPVQGRTRLRPIYEV